MIAFHLCYIRIVCIPFYRSNVHRIASCNIRIEKKYSMLIKSVFLLNHASG